MRVHIFFGPVQEFVSEARRTRDLWAGSWLLSYLAGQAMYEIVSGGGRIVLPAVQDASGQWTDPLMKAVAAARNGGPHPARVAPVGSLPNRFEAEIPGEGEKVREVVQAAVEAWRTAWQRETESVWALVCKADSRFASDQQLQETWRRQTEGLWESMWVVGEAQDLDRRKLLRSFNADAEPGEKCTVCGRRQCLYPAAAERREEVRNFWIELARKLRTWDLRRDGRERLCAVCTAKRLLPRVWGAEVSYPSTRTIASIPWRIEVAEKARGAEAKALQNALETFDGAVAEVRVEGQSVPDVSDALRCFGALQAALGDMPEGARKPLARWDGDLFTEDGIIHDDLFSGLSPQEAKRLRQPILEALAKLRGALPAGLKQPTDFYAVLLMDGDRMGQILGENPNRKEEISGALGMFSAGVRDVVEGTEGNGKLIYAGGDDVLAMLPVRTALRVAWRLRLKYFECIGEAPQGWSISAGIVYSHATVPLRPTILAAHRILDEVAKSRVGRDAFAVQVWKRGGPVATAGLPWEVSMPEVGVSQRQAVELLDTLVSRLKGTAEGGFSSKLLYRLSDLWEIAQPGGTMALSWGDTIKLVAAEHLSTVRHAREPSALADAEELARELICLCVEWVGDGTGRRARGLTADAGLFVRFLVQEEV
ncbi:MAG: type III-B CRISPR-associated protein Cas10/Cmr2 [Armatimonadetes bacterium]|nr:type III-B CRISPR-associated protein Cas10/Cmr2 [Armatimonadota bacterium]